MSDIVFCSVFRGRNREVVQNIRNHSPFVDRTFIVLHGNETDNKENIDFFETQECKNLNLSWELVDIPYNPTVLRGKYLSKMPPNTWLLQLDCDEFLEPPACYQLPFLVQKAEKEGFNRIAFSAHDIRVGLDGAVWDNETTFYHPLFVKALPGICWAGETHGGIHTPGIAPRVMQAPYRYFHIKTTASEYLRGCRNYWTTGECAQNNTNVPEWIEFKKLCTKHGIDTFDKMHRLVVGGNIHEDFKRWFVLHRNNSNSEARSWFVIYFVLLHPEENTYLAGSQETLYDKDRKYYCGEMTY